MRRYLPYLVPLALFVGLAAFLLRGLWLDPREIPSPLIGKPVPEFSIPQVRNPSATFSHRDLLGKVSLVNVWATWCVSCRAEHALLVRLGRSGQVPIYGIDWKDDRAKAAEWLQTLGDPYVFSGFDEDGRVAIDWGVYGAPETFVVDAAGIIRYKHAGPLSEELLQQTLLPLVRKLEAEAKS
jgi:cytochrome c biogenesis protein CcmG/thiol:disulfide interchange protein DsbE